MRAIRAILAASKLPMGFAASVSADLHEDAQAAYASGDYKTALGLWRPLADQGDATAQASLGFMHQTGLGAPQDYAEASLQPFLSTVGGNAVIAINASTVLVVVGVTSAQLQASDFLF